MHKKIVLQPLASKFAIIDISLCQHVVVIECLTKENNFSVDFCCLTLCVCVSAISLPQHRQCLSFSQHLTKTASMEWNRHRFECLLKVPEEWWLDRSQHIVELDTVPHRKWYQLWDAGNFVVIEFPTCYWMYAGRNTWIIMVILWKSDTTDPKTEVEICFINVCLF